MFQDLFIGIGFVATILLCIYNIFRLTCSREVRESSYHKFRIACYCIAASCGCLAVGNIVHIVVRGFTYHPAEICSIISTTISVSQSILFTASLIVLYTGQNNILRRVAYHALPMSSFLLAYFIATRFQDDQHYFTMGEFWKSTCTNLPALIRFIFSMTYLVQCGHFIRLILNARNEHLKLIQALPEDSTKDVRLGWITTAFFAALSEALIVIIIEYFPCFATEAIFRIFTIIFYTIFPIYYINYSNTYNSVKKMLDDFQIRNSTPVLTTEDQGIDTLISKITERNNQLFKTADDLIRQNKLYLKQELRIDDLVTEIGTNRTYLASAIKQNRQCTISDYILSLRLDHATKLLSSENNLKMEEVASLSGFNSLRTFNRNFKEAFHITPEEFRNNHKR